MTTPGPVGELRMQQARTLYLNLSKDEALWSADLPIALDRILNTGLAGLATSVASVWRHTDDGRSMVCIAKRDRERGRLPAAGVLPYDLYPRYFEALASDRILAAEQAMRDERTADLVDGYLKPLGVHALLDATLRRSGRVYGVLCFEHLERPRDWSEAERELAASLSDLVSQLMLVDELRRRNQLLQLLNSLAPELGQNHTVEQLARLACKKLIGQFPEVWAGFFRYRVDRQDFELIAWGGSGLTREIVEPVKLLPSRNSYAGVVAKLKKILPIPDLEAAGSEFEIDDGLQALARQHGVRSLIGIPLVYNDDILGLVQVWVRRAELVEATQYEAYESISQTFSMAFANAINLEQLNYRAYHDSLTGLGNRDRLSQDFDKLQENCAALAIVDIREFKQVNDTLGRGHADRLLQALAERLRGFADGGNMRAYRLSGAEFALLVPDAQAHADGGELGDRLVRLVADPIDIGDLTLVLASAVGIARYPEDGEIPHDLLRCADVALNSAKGSSRGVAVYDASKDDAGPRNLELLTELRKAMGRGQLSLVFQPKIDIASGSLTGAEALLRWEHPKYGFVSPDRFIPVAETGDLMGELTHWVAHEALRQIRAFREAGIGLAVSINVSAHNMVDAQFPQQMRSLLRDSGVEAEALRLEITETVLMTDPERASEVIAELSELGFALDIDDFGTGYSSLAYLRRLPLTALKIDRTFVQELPSHKQDEVIVRSTVGMAHGLNLQAIAEGVEDRQTLDMLRQLGCDQAQGYFISRPLPAGDFRDWARSWKGIPGA
jgi:diguanylate cyclase (GGDEF)-like protein